MTKGIPTYKRQTGPTDGSLQMRAEWAWVQMEQRPALRLLGAVLFAPVWLACQVIGLFVRQR